MGRKKNTETKNESNLFVIQGKCREILCSTLPGSRSPEQITALVEYSTRSKIFPASLDDIEVLGEICQGMELLALGQNTILFLQGQPATSYFITFSGAVDILQTRDLQHLSEVHKNFSDKVLEPLGSEFNRTQLGNYLCRLPENKGFGELALITEGGKRAASALSTCRSELIEIRPDLYVRLVKPYHIDQANVGVVFEIIRDHFLCEGLSGRSLTKIAYTMQPVKFGPRTKICSEGEHIDRAILIETGEIKELKLQSELQVEVSTRGKGTLIGAIDLIKGCKRHSSGFIAVTKVEGYSISLEGMAVIIGNKETVKKYRTLESARSKLLQPCISPKIKNVKKQSQGNLKFTDALAKNLNLVGNETEATVEMSERQRSLSRSYRRDPDRKSAHRDVERRFSQKVADEQDAKPETQDLTIQIKSPPALKPQNGIFSSITASPLVSKKQALSRQSLGAHLGLKSATKIYAEESKRKKSLHVPVDDLLSNLQDQLTDKTMVNLASGFDSTDPKAHRTRYSTKDPNVPIKRRESSDIESVLGSVGYGRSPAQTSILKPSLRKMSSQPLPENSKQAGSILKLSGMQQQNHTSPQHENSEDSFHRETVQASNVKKPSSQGVCEREASNSAALVKRSESELKIEYAQVMELNEMENSRGHPRTPTSKVRNLKQFFPDDMSLALGTDMSVDSKHQQSRGLKNSYFNSSPNQNSSPKHSTRSVATKSMSSKYRWSPQNEIDENLDDNTFFGYEKEISRKREKSSGTCLKVEPARDNEIKELVVQRTLSVTNRKHSPNSCKEPSVFFEKGDQEQTIKEKVQRAQREPSIKEKPQRAQREPSIKEKVQRPHRELSIKEKTIVPSYEFDPASKQKIGEKNRNHKARKILGIDEATSLPGDAKAVESLSDQIAHVPNRKAKKVLGIDDEKEFLRRVNVPGQSVKQENVVSIETDNPRTAGWKRNMFMSFIKPDARSVRSGAPTN